MAHPRAMFGGAVRWHALPSDIASGSCAAGPSGNDQPQPLELTEVNEEGMDCWRVHTTKKLRQCLQALEDQPTSTVTWCTGLIATEPVDYMSARLQHLDATQGFGLKELVASRGLLHEFHEHTWARLSPWISNGIDHSQKLKVIVDHMGRMCGKKFDKQGCYQSIRSYTLSVSSAVWAEIELKFWHWPFVLLRGVRGSAANEEADSVLDSFFDEDLCCLDSGWAGRR